MNISVSTMWGAQGRYPDLGDMVDGVREAGGGPIEINYMPTREQLEQLLARPDLVVSSVHNICPRPTDAQGNRIPDPSLVATDDAERHHAVALTKGTMDLCRRVGGTVIVVHAGDLVVDLDAEKQLDALYRDGKSETDEFASLRAQIVAKRTAVAGPAIERLLLSLAELVPYAEATGIRLGIETRQDYRDIPAIDELGIILDRFQTEERALTAIAMQQPVIRDLRTIVAVLNITSELERMGDHAEGIATISLMIGDEPLLKPLIDVPRMADKVTDMLRRALLSFGEHDAATARRIAAEDDDVDALYNQVYRELLTFMLQDPRTIHQATLLLWAAHNLERIGDRITNICERVVFTETGRMQEFRPSLHPVR